MEGPRPARPDELESLDRLLDHVFMEGREGAMARLFPTFLTAKNAENLFIYTQNGEVVSHVGMALHHATLGGCAVGVACIGAVATYEEHRGRGLASRLMDFARERARAWGADIMLISGGRGLYRRMGAANAGMDTDAAIGQTAANSLELPNVELHPASPEDARTFDTLYSTRPARFFRPLDDWRAFLTAKVAMCRDVDFFLVCHNGHPVAYLVTSHDAEFGVVRVIEFAGDAMALGAACKPLLDCHSAKQAEWHLQPSDGVLRRLFESAGAELSPATAAGTLLVLGVPRLLGRMAPLLESRAGLDAAKSLTVSERDGQWTFSAVGNNGARETRTAASLAQATELIFGSPDHPEPEGVFGELFPLPSLWYGLNYV